MYAMTYWQELMIDSYAYLFETSIERYILVHECGDCIDGAIWILQLTKGGLLHCVREGGEQACALSENSENHRVEVLAYLDQFGSGLGS